MNYEMLIDELESMQGIDLANTPAMLVTDSLRRKLITNGFDPDLAEEIACSVNVNLPQRPVPEETIDRVAELIVRILVKMRGTLRDKGFNHPGKCLVIWARRFDLSLS